MARSIGSAFACSSGAGKESRVAHVASQGEDFTIRRTSTADQVADALRARILKGEIPPGTPLREVALSASLGVSRNTVREGVRVLVSEGLLTHNVHRGVVVTALSFDDVKDVYEVRTLIETTAILRADLRDGRLVAEMERTLQELTRAIELDDREAIVDLDLEFHRLSVDALGSPRLSAFYSNTIGELRLALFVLDKLEGEWRDWIVGHRDIVEALRQGKRRDCLKLVERHLNEARDRLLRVVAGVGESA
jgi:DNA-binding GntR family transcriptional regulator